MKVQRGLTCSAALLIILTHAACADSPEAGTIDTPTSTESASTEPESTAPSDPETATTEPASEPTEEPPVLEEVPGEEPEITFVKHFFAMHEYAQRTGDVERYLALGDDDCESCVSTADWISEKYDAGGHIRGGQYELIDEPMLFRNLDPVEVRLTLSEAETTVVKAEGAEPDVLPACDALRLRVQLEQKGDQWLVMQYYVQTACE